MYCPNCGNVVAENSRFCGICGTAVPAQPVDPFIGSLLRGDSDAMTRLYETRWKKLYAIAYRTVGNEYDAEDIVQDVFLRLPEHLQGFRGGNLDAWLGTITRNRALNAVKRKRPTSFSDMGDEEATAFVDTLAYEGREFQPEANVDYTETKEIIHSLLAELPEKQKICIELRYGSDLKISEIAEKTAMPEATVKSCLKYAKDKLEKQIVALKKQGVHLFSVSSAMLIPFLRWLLSGQEKNLGKFATTSGAGAATGGTAASSIAGGTVIGEGTVAVSAATGTTVAGSAATGGVTGAAVTTAGLSLAAKIAIAATAAALLIGGGVAAGTMIANRDKQANEASTLASDFSPNDTDSDDVLYTDVSECFYLKALTKTDPYSGNPTNALIQLTIDSEDGSVAALNEQMELAYWADENSSDYGGTSYRVVLSDTLLCVSTWHFHDDKWLAANFDVRTGNQLDYYAAAALYGLSQNVASQLLGNTLSEFLSDPHMEDGAEISLTEFDRQQTLLPENLRQSVILPRFGEDGTFYGLNIYIQLWTQGKQCTCPLFVQTDLAPSANTTYASGPAVGVAAVPYDNEGSQQESEAETEPYDVTRIGSGPLYAEFWLDRINVINDEAIYQQSEHPEEISRLRRFYWEHFGAYAWVDEGGLSHEHVYEFDEEIYGPYLLGTFTTTDGRAIEVWEFGRTYTYPEQVAGQSFYVSFALEQIHGQYYLCIDEDILAAIQAQANIPNFYQ